jgi:uncharacterized membrane protein
MTPSIAFGLFVLLLNVVYHVAPLLSRRRVYFSVAVDADFRDSVEGRAILGRYRLHIWTLGIAIVLVAAVCIRLQILGSILFPVCLLAQIIGGWLAFLSARRRIGAYTVALTAVREAEITGLPSLPGGIVGQIGPYVILGAAAALLAWRYPDLPERFPVHWSFAWKPDGWANKSPQTAFRVLLLGGVICGAMSLQLLGLFHRSRTTGGKRAILLNTLTAQYCFALICSYISLAPVFLKSLNFGNVVGPILLIGLVSHLIVKIRQAETVGDAASVPRKLAGRWRFRFFYYNPDDPAVFVEKRFGIGYTVNFGNPWGWTALLLPIALFVLALGYVF